MNYAEYMVSVLRPVGFFSAYVILIIEAAHAISNKEEWSFSFDLFSPLLVTLGNKCKSASSHTGPKCRTAQLWTGSACIRKQTSIKDEENYKAGGHCRVSETGQVLGR